MCAGGIRGGGAGGAPGSFWRAGATDFAAGWVARRFGESTPLGGLVDMGGKVKPLVAVLAKLRADLLS